MNAWTCAFCHYLNVGSRTHCQVCDRTKEQARKELSDAVGKTFRYVCDEASRTVFKIAGFRTEHPLSIGSLITVGIAQYRVTGFPRGSLGGTFVSLTELPTSIPTLDVEHVA